MLNTVGTQIRISDLPNCKIADVILSQEKPFTAEEIMKILHMKGVPIKGTDEINRILDIYRENGMVIKRGKKHLASILYAR